MIEKYIKDKNISNQAIPIDELSRIYLTHVTVLSELYEITILWKAFKEEIEPCLKIARGLNDTESEARLLYAAQIVSTSLRF